MKIEGSVAIVTGAASGIGKAIAERLHDAGARAVVIADLNGDGAQAVAGAIGDSAMAVQADVADEAAVRDLVARTCRRFGEVDLFASNAGLTVAGGFEVPDDGWRRAIDVNLMAHVYAARAVLPAMLERGHGHLLQTIAAAGVLTAFGAAPYTVAKHGAVAFAEYIAVHYGDRGIGVTCLCTQAVNTPMLAASVANYEELAVLKSLSEVLEPGQVAAAALAGVEANRMHVFTHADSIGSFRRRAQDPDKWVAEMRALLAARGA